MDGRSKIFVSYSHEDSRLFQEFETMLAPAVQRGLVDVWDDQRILPGAKWEQEIQKALASARIAVLLVSKNFLASHFIAKNELPPLLKAAQDQGVTIFWIYLGSCLYEQTEIATYQAAHDISRPLSELPKAQREAVLSKCCSKLIQMAVETAQIPEPFRPPSRPSLHVGVDPRNLPDRSIFKDVDEPWCPEMVIIPAGSYLMGSPTEDDDAYPEEKPQHRVNITRFAIGRYLVTFDEFDYFCDATKRRKPSDEGWGRGRRPVIWVCWNDARDFCLWLANTTARPYRLPTEAEWEYACRAGTETKFYYANYPNVKHANFDNARKLTTEVGHYTSNPWGIFDILGNVWEHVEDPYHDSYQGAPDDGSAWLDGADLSHRVVRGGSYSYSAKDCRSAVRCEHECGRPDRQHGFRLARSL